MITKDMKIGAVMAKYPQTIPVFNAFGLDCRDCQIAEYEEVEHGASVHGAEIEKLLEELNRVINE